MPAAKFQKPVRGGDLQKTRSRSLTIVTGPITEAGAVPSRVLESRYQVGDSQRTEQTSARDLRRAIDKPIRGA